MTPDAELKGRILRSLASLPPCPTRRQRAEATRWMVGLCLAAAAAAFGLLAGGGLGLRVLPRPGESAAWAVCALAVGLLARHRGRDLLGPPEGLLWAASLLAFALPSAGVLLRAPFAPRDLATAPDRILESFESVLAVGLPLLLAFLLVRRKSDPLHPEAQGALWGALAGCLSVTAVGSALPLHGPAELLLGQILPYGLLIGAGSTLGSVLLDMAPHVPPLRAPARNQQIGRNRI